MHCSFAQRLRLTREQLPRGAEENPLSQHLEDAAEGRTPGPGASTFGGGDNVKR